jgi:DNA replication initiation complex subunit (GINS family)
MDYETLRNVQRAEKNKSRLSEIPEDFYKELRELIRNSMKKYEETRDLGDLRNFENIVRVARDMFYTRQQKIIMKAYRNVRTQEYDDNGMVSEEKKFYRELVDIIQKNAEFFESMVVNGKEEKRSTEEIQELPEEEPVKKDLNIVMVRILKNIPRFVGSDLNEYGPYEPNQIVKLPKKEAEFLVSKNLAEVI